MARTDTLTNYLTDVATAIKNKKGDSTPIQASNFDTEIANLPSGGYGELYDEIPINVAGVQNGPNINALSRYPLLFLAKSVPYFEATVKGGTGYCCGWMFSRTYIKDIDVSGISIDFTDGQLIYFKGMFANCPYLSAVTFKGENGWRTDLTQAGKNINFSLVFQNDDKLEYADLSPVTNATGYTIDINSLFDGCSSLQFVDIRSLDFSAYTGTPSTVFNGVPTDCTIIVADNTQKAWMTTNYPDYTNVKTVAEYENE